MNYPRFLVCLPLFSCVFFWSLDFSSFELSGALTRPKISNQIVMKRQLPTEAKFVGKLSSSNLILGFSQNLTQ